MSKAVPEAVIVSSPAPVAANAVSTTTAPVASTVTTTSLVSKDTFTTKRVMGLVLVLSLIGLGIAWIALSVAGLPGWINIVLIIVALLMIVVIGWLFFSP
ncbi:Transmembrane domain-containing protein [Brazilian cedratvirus IHUMI]|uniref:Transmembrane domain-containing protein n=1 Tax=Brazilian cedratvirus IHUMI TaxID=2126980 RepID=A0A2R8FFS2_9VIRU|nr:Transmembrane domain-containing protein [Brazilian cedratvirus IHUMI]